MITMEFLKQPPTFLIASYSAVWFRAFSFRVSLIQTALFLVASYLFVFWVALIFWTWRDCQGRYLSRRYRWFCLILVFLFNLPGILIYLLIRPPTFKELERARLEEEILRLELADLKRKKL